MVTRSPILHLYRSGTRCRQDILCSLVGRLPLCGVCEHTCKQGRYCCHTVGLQYLHVGLIQLSDCISDDCPADEYTVPQLRSCSYNRQSTTTKAVLTEVPEVESAAPPTPVDLVRFQMHIVALPQHLALFHTASGARCQSSSCEDGELLHHL